jgi:hypothetical protein
VTHEREGGVIMMHLAVGSCVAHDVDDVADSRSGAGRSFSTSAARLNDAAKRLGSGILVCPCCRSVL